MGKCRQILVKVFLKVIFVSMPSHGVILKKIHFKSQLNLAYEVLTMHISWLKCGNVRNMTRWHFLLAHEIYHRIKDKCKTCLTVRHILISEV